MKIINIFSFKNRGFIKFMFMLFIINLFIKFNNFNLVYIFFYNFIDSIYKIE